MIPPENKFECVQILYALAAGWLEQKQTEKRPRRIDGAAWCFRSDPQRIERETGRCTGIRQMGK